MNDTTQQQMQYPYDIVSLVRKKTFSIEGHFLKKEDDSPMKIFGNMSRFVFSIIEDKKAATFNLNLEELPILRAKTDAIAQHTFSRGFTQVTAAPAAKEEGGLDTTTPAFTVKFTTGSLKGKTPAEIVASDPDYKKTLTNQVKFLKENLAKYPANQAQIDAIMDACKLTPDQLKDVNTSGTAGDSLELLDIGVRPLIRKKREDGMCPCYEARIAWNNSDNYPVTVTIKNYYAPFVQKDNGTINVTVSGMDKSTLVSRDFHMTAADWLYCLSEMESAREAFRVYNFGKAWNMAEAAAEAARKAKAATQQQSA
jgi:hypothetical protein